MLLTNPQIDPIVEILRLAYRRGLVIRQAQIQEKAAKPDNLALTDSDSTEVHMQEQEDLNVPK